MASDAVFRITHEEGQFLLRYSGGVRIPEKLGEEKFDLAERSFADDALSSLRSVLKTYSPILQRDRRACFGNADNWTPQDGNGAAWKMIDPDRTQEVRFNEDAIDGAYWCMLLALHPASPAPMNPGEIGDVVWPLARKLGLTSALRSACKLTDPSKARKIVRDQEIVK